MSTEPIVHYRAGQPLAAPLNLWSIGQGSIVHSSDGLQLLLPMQDSRSAYSDSQVYNYPNGRPLPNQPPLHLTICARFSHSADQLRGTAGFGLWNQPFMPGQRWPRLPRAMWFFFGSPPSNMKLDLHTDGHGWKAATIDASRWQFLLLAPTAPLGFLAMRNPWLYRRLWPLAQRSLGCAEQAVPSHYEMQAWHTYTIDWQPTQVTFAIDAHNIFTTRRVPRGPLGFIAWVDNQYAIVTPQGQFGFGLVPVLQPQWLQIAEISLEK